jgi:hypothetical protein
LTLGGSRSSWLTIFSCPADIISLDGFGPP